MRAVPIGADNVNLWRGIEDNSYSIQIADVPVYVPYMRPAIDLFSHDIPMYPQVTSAPVDFETYGFFVKSFVKHVVTEFPQHTDHDPLTVAQRIEDGEVPNLPKLFRTPFEKKTEDPPIGKIFSSYNELSSPITHSTVPCFSRRLSFRETT